jgi:hypothetical protein
MERFVKFEKDGLWLYKDGEKIRPEDAEIFSVLEDTCEIEEGVTLLDFFRAVEQYEFLKIFIAQYAWCSDIDAFHQQAEEPFIADEDWVDNVEYLEVYRVLKFQAKYVSNYAGFHGVGRPEDGSDRIEYYSMSYSPLNEFANLPLKLNTSVTVFKGYEGKVVWQGEYRYSVLDVLHAIYDDISFAGGVEDKEDFLDDMKETMKEIDDHIEAGGDLRELGSVMELDFPEPPPNPELN